MSYRINTRQNNFFIDYFNNNISQIFKNNPLITHTIYLNTLFIFAYLYSFSIYIDFIDYIYLKKFVRKISTIHLIPAFCIISSIIISFQSHKKYIYHIIYTICIFFGVIHITHTILYGIEFNAESAIALIITNSDESIEFIKSFSNYKLLTAILLYVFIQYFFTKIIITKLNTCKLNRREKIISLFIIFSLYIPFSSLRNFQTPLNPFFPTMIIKKIIVANKEIRLASILQAGYKHPAKSTYPDPQTIVLIIGESAGRKNMHSYGYPRQTTPDMEGIRYLHVFTDVISSAPTTHKSIGMMLTLADLNNTPYTTSIFDMFKAANFKTFWLSAQFSKQAPESGIVPILAQRADSLWSLKQNLPPTHHYDEFMIPQVHEAINDPAQKKLIVINLLGSHSSYRERIPPHRDTFKFTDSPPSTSSFKNFHGYDTVAQIINEYDTSIRYTDFVVSQIFTSLEESIHGAWAILYLSDHGEEVFDTEKRFGHAGSSTSPNAYEIPFILKMSDDYEQWMRNTNILTLDTKRPYQTDNLIHTLLNLAAIRTPLYDPTKSIVNPNFQARPRWIKNTPYVR